MSTKYDALMQATDAHLAAARDPDLGATQQLVNISVAQVYATLALAEATMTLRCQRSDS